MHPCTSGTSICISRVWSTIHHIYHWLMNNYEVVLILYFNSGGRYISISKSFFSQQAFGNGENLGNGVECWRGYYQSLRPTQMGLSLNIGRVVCLYLMLSALNCLLLTYRFLCVYTWWYCNFYIDLSLCHELFSKHMLLN